MKHCCLLASKSIVKMLDMDPTLLTQANKQMFILMMRKEELTSTLSLLMLCSKSKIQFLNTKRPILGGKSRRPIAVFRLMK